MNIQELIATIRLWQVLNIRYLNAVAESPHYTSQRRRVTVEAMDVAAQVVIGCNHEDRTLAAFVALADEVQRLQASTTAQNRRAKALRVTVWESQRDAQTALAFLQKKDKEALS